MVFGRTPLILSVPEQALSVKLSFPDTQTSHNRGTCTIVTYGPPRVNGPLTTSRFAGIDVDFNSGNLLQLVLDTLHHFLLAPTEILFLCFRIACLFDLIILFCTLLPLRHMRILTLILILLQCLL